MEVCDIIQRGTVEFFGKENITIVTTRGAVLFKGEYDRNELMETLCYKILFAKVAYLDRDNGLIIGIFG